MIISLSELCAPAPDTSDTLSHSLARPLAIQIVRLSRTDGRRQRLGASAKNGTVQVTSAKHNIIASVEQLKQTSLKRRVQSRAQQKMFTTPARRLLTMATRVSRGDVHAPKWKLHFGGVPPESLPTLQPTHHTAEEAQARDLGSRIWGQIALTVFRPRKRVRAFFL